MEDYDAIPYEYKPSCKTETLEIQYYSVSNVDATPVSRTGCLHLCTFEDIQARPVERQRKDKCRVWVGFNCAINP